jgi:hypothetical protein
VKWIDDPFSLLFYQRLDINTTAQHFRLHCFLCFEIQPPFLQFFLIKA